MGHSAEKQVAGPVRSRLQQETEQPQFTTRTAISVLVLERGIPPAHRCLAYLERGGFEVAFDIACGADQFRSRLATKRYDVIIARDQVPGFTAREAMEIVQQMIPRTPVILVTAGRANPLVQYCLRHGAADYVTTADLGRLPLSVCHALRQSAREGEGEEWFRSMVDSMREVFFVTDLEGRPQYASPAAERIWGRRVASFEAFRRLVVPDDQALVDRAFQRVAVGEQPEDVEFRIRHPDGSLHWILGHVVPVRDAAGRVTGISGINQDITEHRRAREALEESELKLRKLLEVSFDGILVAQDGVIVEANPRLARIFGYEPEEALGRPVLDLVAPEDQAMVRARVLEGFEGTYECTGIRKDGKRLQLEVAARMHILNGRPCRITAVRDLTERRLLEEQFNHAQKMEAVGRLAGGVAHDFNNLLTVISSYSTMLLDDMSDRDPRAADLREIQNAATTAANLTRQLLAFSRQQVVQPRVLSLEATVGATAKLLKRLIGEDITLAIVPKDTPVHVHIDPGQLEQIVMNLAVNARDAMPGGGRLTIETGIARLGEAYSLTHWPLNPGEYAVLAVSDNGIGMDEATRARIFEPFFTTKEAGKGTGLGLATVYGIVKQNGGFIWVYSEPGQGTCFKIYLPLMHPTETTELASISTSQEALVGTETVLLTEDAAPVRSVVRLTLERLGYTVFETPSAEAALEFASRRKTPFDLLLTDLVLPGLNGKELAQQLTSIQPGLKVLYMSGYTDDAAIRHGLVNAGVPYLQKPFTGDQLALKVRETLGRDGKTVRR